MSATKFDTCRGRGTLKLAAEGVVKPWQMKRERMSPAYTTRWEDLPRVR